MCPGLTRLAPKGSNEYAAGTRGKCRSQAHPRLRQPGVSVRPVAADNRAKVLTFRVTFEGSDRVERVRAEAYKSVPPYVQFVVTEGEGLSVRDRVVVTFDGRQIARITTTG